MSTLSEIEQAANALPLDQQEILLKWLSERMHEHRLSRASIHSVLDIAPVSLGRMIHPLNSEEDLLSEMLKDRE